MDSIGSPLLWTGFAVLVLFLLALDLGIFHRVSRRIGFTEALAWSGIWVGVAALFNGWIWWHGGAVPATEFLTGYLIEKTLSLDNVFVFAIVFSYFAIREELQHRVLFWGVLGALVMRAAFIAAGASLITRFHWILYLFGAVLVATGIKLLVQRNQTMDPAHNWLVRGFRRLVPMTEDVSGDRFVVRRNGKLKATPLLLVLVVIEGSDLLFAIDSLPAIFAITTDPFLVFSSNVFAILGMRSLYFALAGLVARLKYLKVGLAAVLVLVGAKMLLVGIYKPPVLATLVAVVLLLGGSAALSLWSTRPRNSVTVARDVA